MILADTSIWIDHFRAGDPLLARRLEEHEVMAHQWVIGELALGALRQRDEILQLLASLPQAPLASEDEVLELIDRHHLAGTGIGYVDAQLLASTLLAAGARLWTRDRRLAAQARRIGLAA